MDNRKMKDILTSRLKRDDRKVTYDREQETLRIEQKETEKGITISLPGIVAKWTDKKDAAIEEVIYYVENGLAAMEDEGAVSNEEANIYPVIRSRSFPDKSAEEIPFFYDDHTAETRIYYAIDMGKTYRLIDEELIKSQNLSKERIREVAKFNVRSLSTNLKEDNVSGNTFYFLNTNDGYDASRILNTTFLNKMCEKIEGEMAVAVPHQDVLIIADIRNETGYDILAQMTMSFFTNGHIPITALSFIYENEKLEPVFILGKNRSRK